MLIFVIFYVKIFYMPDTNTPLTGAQTLKEHLQGLSSDDLLRSMIKLATEVSGDAKPAYLDPEDATYPFATPFIHGLERCFEVTRSPEEAKLLALGATMTLFALMDVSEAQSLEAQLPNSPQV